MIGITENFLGIVPAGAALGRFVLRAEGTRRESSMSGLRSSQPWTNDSVRTAAQTIRQEEIPFEAVMWGSVLDMTATYRALSGLGPFCRPNVFLGLLELVTIRHVLIQTDRS